MFIAYAEFGLSLQIVSQICDKVLISLIYLTLEVTLGKYWLYWKLNTLVIK